MDELLLFTMTRPSLHFKQTGSFLQFLLTSAPLNTNGRALTIHSDEPFTALQTDGLLLTTLIDELLLFTVTSPSLHFKQTGSSLQLLLTSSPLNTYGLALPSTQMDELLLFTIDEPFTTLQTDGLLLTTLIDELSPQHIWTSSYNS